MNLVPKLSMAFITGVSIILAVAGGRRIRREVGLFESDRIHDDVQIGKTLATAVTTVWNTDGQARALSMVRDADAQEGRVRVRWVWLDGTAATPLPVPLASVEAVPVGSSLSLVGSDGHGDRRYTFVPVAVPGRAAARSRSPSRSRPEHAYIRRTIIDTVLTDAHPRRRLRGARDGLRRVDRRAADGDPGGEGAPRRRRRLRRAAAPPPARRDLPPRRRDERDVRPARRRERARGDGDAGAARDARAAPPRRPADDGRQARLRDRARARDAAQRDRGARRDDRQRRDDARASRSTTRASSSARRSA